MYRIERSQTVMDRKGNRNEVRRKESLQSAPDVENWRDGIAS